MEDRPKRRERGDLRNRILAAGSAILLLLLLLFSFTGPGAAFWGRLMSLAGHNGISDVALDAPLNIHVLDVGKAAAILIECEGQSLLLDGGTVDKGDKVSDYLTRRGIGKLDCIVSSHPDKDHIGGLPQVLQEHGARLFCHPALAEEILPHTDEFLALEAVLKETGTEQSVQTPGSVYSLGGAKLTFLAPLREYDNTNDSSLVFKLSYGDFTALFCGDMEEEAEEDLVASGIDLNADLLKVSHHGSNTSSTKKFLKAVSPRYAVISVGPDKNNLPQKKVLRRLENFDAEIYRTDIDGTVIFSYDGEAITVYTERE
ncbi:MAG: ComEC/Rec2 family competence protein [Neglectibacter sp.]